MKRQRYDVIVVGGGHGGCEAAAAAARIGACVALVTMRADMIGAMSCNPAIGGLGKGHLVREVDALGGVIGQAADQAAIHYRMLNRSKGPAVWGPRVQADRTRFSQAVQSRLATLPTLDVVEGEADSLILAAKTVKGLLLTDGRRFDGSAVVLATGTFLGGRLFEGSEVRGGGRAGEAASLPLARQLREMALPMARLKTGTPPRLDGRTLDWARLEQQPSDGDSWTMAAAGRRVLPQLACAITRTNARTHAIIAEARDRSPLYSGAIEGRGPRYCPSIEDKVVRFADRDGHQIFLEPEGLDTPLVYPNGISTSLPAVIQQALVRTIAGLEQAEIVRPGYAVEYDHVDPRCLDRRLAVRAFDGLFLAGQINGTTGYEEAAAQGLIAGANAALAAAARAPLLLGRADSYIGVMIDDLTLQGVTEPYRMLTARAEHRLRLRGDNAGTRLGELAGEAGLLSPDQRARLAERRQQRESATRLLAAYPKLADSTVASLYAAHPNLSKIPPMVTEEIIIDARYAPYVERQKREVAQVARDERIPIPTTLDYGSIPGLSAEMRERLSAARPGTLGEASRVRGITPAALSVILAYARREAA